MGSIPTNAALRLQWRIGSRRDFPHLSTLKGGGGICGMFGLMHSLVTLARATKRAAASQHSIRATKSFSLVTVRQRRNSKLSRTVWIMMVSRELPGILLLAGRQSL